MAGPTSKASDGVTIVLPAFNAAESIGATIAGLRAELVPLGRPLELVVVDDGSTDNTAAVVRELQTTTSGIRLLRNHRNLGKGLSVYVGVLAATQPKVCFTDADLPFTHGSYAKVVQLALDGCPFAAASRRMPQSEILVRMEVLGYAARRHFVGVVFNTIVRLLLALPYRDTQCGLKAFDRSIAIDLLRRLRSPRFLFDIELLVAAHEMGIDVVEVPVCIAYNDFKSSVRLAEDSARMLVGLLGIAWRFRRGLYRTVNPEVDPDAVAAQASEGDGGAIESPAA